MTTPAERQSNAVFSPVAPVAIVGIGCLFPRAADRRMFWSNIKAGTDAISEVPATHWAPDDYFDADPKAPDMTYARRGGFLDPVEFNPLDYGIAPRDLDATDTSQLLGLVAAKQALIDAGYGPERTYDRDRVSVILGVTGTLELVIPLGARLGHPRWKKAMAEAGIPQATADWVSQNIADSYVGWQENSFPGLLGNVVAGRISNRFDLGGTNCVVDAACASSLSAIHLACLELAAGRSDMVVSGGIDTFNDIFMYMCFSKTPALSPTGNAKPFDANGDGTIIGEGLGVVILKRLADAERDGDTVYAVIKGIGTSSDGKGNAIYAPSAAGQKKALRDAYRNAGVSPDTVELVEAHGTGTKVGDAAEISALAEVYRDARAEGKWAAVGSVKSQIGHTKAAAGSAGIIKAALALHYKALPPTIKIGTPLPGLGDAASPLYANTELRPWVENPKHPRRAALSAFGFGGSNFHCVLEERGPAKTEIDWDGDVEIFAAGAGSPAELKTALDTWEKAPESDLHHLAALSRERYHSTAECRLLVVHERGTMPLAERMRWAGQAWMRINARLRGTTRTASSSAPVPRRGSWRSSSPGRVRSGRGCCATWPAGSPRCWMRCGMPTGPSIRPANVSACPMRSTRFPPSTTRPESSRRRRCAAPRLRSPRSGPSKRGRRKCSKRSASCPMSAPATASAN